MHGKELQHPEGVHFSPFGGEDASRGSFREINLRTRIVFGDGALDCLKEIHGKNVLIVCDNFIVQSGVAQRVAALPVDCTISVFSDVVPDPPLETVAKGVAALQESNAQVLIAVGGGSAIDAAKSIYAVARRMPGATEGERLKFYAIPTTSGTGSEVTEYAVISDTQKGVKYPLSSLDMRPDVAVLASELVVSAPPSITADTGMDVLTHAMEALVSNNANDFSDALAEKAVSITCKFLPMAFENGADLLARQEMHNASCLAGISFNSAGLGLNHAIAHAIGGIFHVPHGRANAMILPLVMEFNADMEHYHSEEELPLAAKKYSRLARLVELPVPSTNIGVYNLIWEVRKLAARLKIPTSLTEYGIAREEVLAAKEQLIEHALGDATIVYNPRPVSAQDISVILDRLIG